MKLKKGKWSGLLLHHTAGATKDTVESIRKIHINANGWGDIGYHFFIEIDEKGRGHLKTARDTKYWGAHAGVDKYNENYIGLAVAGNYSVSSMPEDLYNDMISAICQLFKKYNLTHLKGHKEVKATECPGKYLSMAKIREDVSKRLGYTVK